MKALDKLEDYFFNYELPVLEEVLKKLIDKPNDSRKQHLKTKLIECREHLNEICRAYGIQCPPYIESIITGFEKQAWGVTNETKKN